MISEFDFHIHSKYSFDSIISPEKIVKVSKNKGLKGIAIVDHNSIQGGLEARKYETEDFFVILGSEIKTDVGDIIGIFINEDITSQDVFSVIDEVHEQNGIAILPHPFRGIKNGRFSDELLKKIDVIEGYNSRISSKKNLRAQEFAKRNNLPVIGGSDAHFYGEIGAARTIMENVFSEDDIKYSILKNKSSIEGSKSQLYYRGGSRIIATIKSGRWYELPYVIGSISLKGIKMFRKKLK